MSTLHDTSLETFVRFMNILYRLVHDDQPMTLEQGLQRARDIDALHQLLDKVERQG